MNKFGQVHVWLHGAPKQTDTTEKLTFSHSVAGGNNSIESFYRTGHEGKNNNELILCFMWSCTKYQQLPEINYQPCDVLF